MPRLACREKGGYEEWCGKQPVPWVVGGYAEWLASTAGAAGGECWGEVKTIRSQYAYARVVEIRTKYQAARCHNFRLRVVQWRQLDWL